MKTNPKCISRGPIAIQTGLLAGCLAAGLAMVDVRLAAVPLTGFVMLCLAAPFFPRFGFFVPIIHKGGRSQNAVALTFDDGPDPLTTPPLLRLLEKRGVAATFFVIGEKAAAHPNLIKNIIQKGHMLGNHSFRHNSSIFFQGVAAVVADMEATQRVLIEHGVEPLVYRPPMGIVSPRFRPALLKTGLTLVNFSNRPLDRGNRRLGNLAGRILRRLRNGDIVLLHDTRPPENGQINKWLKEVETVLDGIEKSGKRVVPLPELIGKPAMIML